jgi:hypothetical protein
VGVGISIKLGIDRADVGSLCWIYGRWRQVYLDNMRELTTISILLISLTICKGQSDFVVLQDQKTVDELISIFKILPESTMTTTLSTTELDAATRLLTKCITDYNDQIREGFKKRGEKKRYARMYQVMTLSKYKVQFVPYLNEKGEKEIWINGFCSDYDIDWKTEIVHVFDGGNCYFTVRLNLTDNKCIAVGTNGYA